MPYPVEQCSFTPTKRTPIFIELCLRSRIGLWENYYCAPFDIMYCFSSGVGLTNIVVRYTLSPHQTVPLTEQQYL